MRKFKNENFMGIGSVFCSAKASNDENSTNDRMTESEGECADSQNCFMYKTIVLSAKIRKNKRRNDKICSRNLGKCSTMGIDGKMNGL